MRILSVVVLPLAVILLSAASPAPVTVTASASPKSCSSPASDVANDLGAAYAYDLESPAILHFVSVLAAVPAGEQKRVFDGAIDAASSPQEHEVEATVATGCPNLDAIDGASRALFLIANEWQLDELEDDKRFGEFSDRLHYSTLMSCAKMGALLLARGLRTAPIAALTIGTFIALGFAPARAGVPACFVEPPDALLAIAGSTDVVACTLLAKLLHASDETQLAWIPGAVLNKTLGLSTDAFPDSAYAVRFVVTPQFNAAFSGPDALVRFASNGFAAQVGSWWTVLETVTDRSGRLEDKATIASELALPASSVPSVEAAATEVRVGTVGYFGLVAPAFAQPGGGVQFWFPGEPVYSSTRPLP